MHEERGVSLRWRPLTILVLFRCYGNNNKWRLEERLRRIGGQQVGGELRQRRSLGLGETDVSELGALHQVANDAQNAGATTDEAVILLGHVVGKDDLGPTTESGNDAQDG